MLSNEERELEIKKLMYNSWHRGCKETDLLLGKFAEYHLKTLTDEEISDYKALLEEDDWDIFNWLTEKSPFPEKHQNSAVSKLRQFKFADPV